MLKKIAHVVFFVFCGSVNAETIYTCTKDGKQVFQNWKCGEQPEIEKKKKQAPDYNGIVACSMNGTIERMNNKAMTGKNSKIKNCTP